MGSELEWVASPGVQQSAAVTCLEGGKHGEDLPRVEARRCEVRKGALERAAAQEEGATGVNVEALQLGVERRRRREVLEHLLRGLDLAGDDELLDLWVGQVGKCRRGHGRGRKHGPRTCASTGTGCRRTTRPPADRKRGRHARERRTGCLAHAPPPLPRARYTGLRPVLASSDWSANATAGPESVSFCTRAGAGAGGAPPLRGAPALRTDLDDVVPPVDGGVHL